MTPRTAPGRLHIVLLAVCVLVLAWSGIAPKDRLTWVLEVAPAVIAAAAIAAIYPRWRFTPLVLILIAVHAVILMVGGKYTYAEVPLFSWLRDEFGLARNYYDRVGHFAQGFVPAMVAREILLRNHVLPPGRWLFFFVTCVCLAISACYEFLEWWAAAIAGGAADAFLGTQGDVWDTQWDMFLALCGAIAAQLTLARLHDRDLGIAPPSGPLTLCEVTAGNIDWVGDLRVKESQKFHIASIAKSVWQGAGRADVWLRCIQVGEHAVGYVMVVDKSLAGEAANEVYLARLMVDQRWQGRGYGRAALRLVLEYARSRPGCVRVRLSHMPDNERVGRYYEQEGFRHTGNIDADGELEMVLELRPAPQGENPQ